jgi:thiol-disulfide isomerase/thioredoxin
MSVTAYHFWSPTCGPCKVIKPAVEDLKEEFPNVTWITVNTHEDPQNFVKEFAVQVVPTIVVLAKDSNGKITHVEKQSGTAMAQYYRILRNALRSIA